jgi:hypothetical protein
LWGDRAFDRSAITTNRICLNFLTRKTDVTCDCFGTRSNGGGPAYGAFTIGLRTGCRPFRDSQHRARGRSSTTARTAPEFLPYHSCGSYSGAVRKSGGRADDAGEYVANVKMPFNDQNVFIAVKPHSVEQQTFQILDCCATRQCPLDGLGIQLNRAHKSRGLWAQSLAIRRFCRAWSANT